MIIPVSGVIPTYNRAVPLEATLKSLAKQFVQFAEIIVIDASENDHTRKLCLAKFEGLESRIVYRNAIKKGAASQRNEGVDLAQYPFIGFMDDDIYLEPFCLERLWGCFEFDRDTGGVNAMITNQKYEMPGRLTRFMCRLIGGHGLSSYAGKCIGPAWNFLPEDNPELPEFVSVDWLNLGLTIYRVQALPKPPFQSHFIGYSMMEDLTLSITVKKKWKIYNARTARIYHDSQPGVYKSNVRDLEKMELINRHFIMTSILERRSILDYLKLGLLEGFKLLSLMSSSEGLKKMPSAITGKFAAIKAIVLQ